MTKDRVNQLDIQTFDGPITVISDPNEVDAAVAELRREPVLGFDTETQPAFRKGESYSPSVLQLGGEGFVYLFMLMKTGLPKSLIDLLEDPSLIKTGVAIEYDVKTLKDHGDFTPGGFVDVGDLARAWGIPNHGLRQLAAQFMGIRISKSSQRSNWGRYPLSEKQVGYAATDAWISLEIYKHFKRLDLLHPPKRKPAPRKSKNTDSSSATTSSSSRAG